MIGALPPARLAELWDTVGQANPLSTIELHQLADGFVLCNLIADLVQSIRRLLASTTHVAAGTVHYDALSAWSSAPNRVPPSPLTPADLETLAHRYLDRDPWYAQNRLVFLDAATREDHAKLAIAVTLAQQLHSTPAAAALDTAPDNASVRSWLQVQWWPWVVEKVADAIEPYLAQPGVPARAALGESLKNALDASDRTARLLGHKMNYLTEAVGKLNERLAPPPLPTGWLGEMSSRLLDTHEALRAARAAGDQRGEMQQFLFRFSQQDCQVLDRLFDWIAEHGFTNRIGRAPEYADGSRLRNICRPPYEAVDLPAYDYTSVVDELAQLERVVRMRNLPADWRRRRPVQDLFSSPMASRLSRYRARITAYGL